MSTAPFTIVVCPRERFSMAQASLNDLYENTPGSFPLIYIDGNSPEKLSSWLQSESQKRGFQILRTDYYLSSHAAYNLALPLIQTPYVIFCDNDVTFSPGWAGLLLACAEETGAALVGPLYLEKSGTHTEIHMAGADIVLKSQGGRWIYHEQHRLGHKPVEDADSLPDRQETAIIEYHAFLGRTDVLKSVNPFDPNLVSVKDHPDACLTLKASGEKCLIEKRARVVYHIPPPLRLADLPFFLTRWSESWNLHSILAFNKKWGFDAELKPWFGRHRRVFLLFITTPLKGLLGWKRAKRFYYDRLDPWIAPLEERLNRLWIPAPDARKLGLADLTKPYPSSLLRKLPPTDAVFFREE